MSILPSLSQRLLNGRSYTAFNEVTNGDSMMAVLSVDVMDNFGRMYMGYRRDGWGRELFERTFEVWTASIVWGFGATVVRNWIDKQAGSLKDAGPLVQKLFNAVGIKDIQSDTLNPDVFKSERGGSKNLQQLTLEKINQTEPQQLKQLEKELSGDKLTKAQNNLKAHNNYLRSFFDSDGKLIEKASGRFSQHIRKEGLKVGLAFALPSAIIGFIVPRIYQHITRSNIQQKKEERYINLSHQLAHQPILAHPPVSGKQLFLNKLLENNTLHNIDANSSRQIKNGFSGSHSPSQPVFGSLGTIIERATERVRQSPAMNTLMIDGVISGGRAYMARNIYERLETIAQELGLIFFAFFARTKIQHFFENTLDALNKTVSKFQLPAVKWFNDAATNNTDGLKQTLTQFKNTFMGADNVKQNGFDFEKSSKFKWNKGTGEIKSNLAALEEHLLNQGSLHKYLLENPEKKEILFELAKVNGDINMHTVSEYIDWNDTNNSQIDKKKLAQFAKARAMSINELKTYLGSKNLDELSSSDKKWIQRANIPVHTTEVFDASQEINMKGLHQTGQKLTKTIQQIQKHFGNTPIENLTKEQLKEFKTLMRKSAAIKWVAWLGSVLVSTAFVGWIIPRGKQLITYFMTGEDKFPGQFNDGKRQNILSTGSSIYPNALYANTSQNQFATQPHRS